MIYYIRLALVLSLMLIFPIATYSLECPNKRVKILSISGGGVRGIIPAIALADIEKKLGDKSIAESFDILTGTSTGAIIVLMLNVPDPNNPGKPKYKAQDIVELYKKLSRVVFKANLGKTILSLNGWISPKYDSKNLTRLLKKYLGDTKLSESLTDIVIPAYDITKSKTEIFNVRQAKLKPEKHDHYMWEVALASTAAPSYFKSFRIGKRDYVDGGLTLNNPVLASMIHSLIIHGRKEVGSYFVVSLGTGKTKLQQLNGFWGKIGWVQHLLNITMDGVSNLNHKQQELIISELNKEFADDKCMESKYVYLDIPIEKSHSDMDDIRKKNIAALEQYGNDLVVEAAPKIEEVIEYISPKH